MASTLINDFNFCFFIEQTDPINSIENNEIMPSKTRKSVKSNLTTEETVQSGNVGDSDNDQVIILFTLGQVVRLTHLSKGLYIHPLCTGHSVLHIIHWLFSGTKLLVS